MESLRVLHLRGHNVIVDKFSKYNYFLSLAQPYITTNVARVFMDNIFKLYKMRQTIVDDWDPNFTSKLLKEMLRISGTELLMTSAYHPQAYEQSEIMNKGLECYLTCFLGNCPKDRARWVSLAEWSYTTSTHTFTQLASLRLFTVTHCHISYLLKNAILEFLFGPLDKG